MEENKELWDKFRLLSDKEIRNMFCFIWGYLSTNKDFLNALKVAKKQGYFKRKEV